VALVDIDAGVTIGGKKYAKLSLRNVSGNNLALPVITAGGNAIAGTNLSMAIRRVG